MYQPTIIYRHRKENKKKCTLESLVGKEGFIFYQYPSSPPNKYDGAIILTLDAPILSIKDREKKLLIIDGTWDYAKKMALSLDKKSLIPRSLPHEIVTAYPRKQTRCQDPKRGLASIEALYAAFHILGKEKKSLLDHYYWKETFLELNKDFFS